MLFAWDARKCHNNLFQQTLHISLKDSVKVMIRQTQEHPTLLPSSSAQRVNREDFGKMRKNLAKIDKTEMSKLALLQQTNITHTMTY